MLRAPGTRRLRARPGQAARRGKSTKRKAQKRSPVYSPNGFLNHVFKPILERGNAFAEAESVEQEFFASLQHLCQLYAIPAIDTSQFHYPINIREAFNKAKDGLKKVQPKLELLLMQTGKHKASLATMKSLDTNMTLFFIPVDKFYHLLKSKKCKLRCDLLLSCLAYFCQAGGVPFYTESDSFIGGRYEMIKEWTINEPGDWEPGDFKNAIKELRTLETAGKRVQRLLKQPAHLQHFEKRICRLRPYNAYDKKLKTFAVKLLSLYQQHGNRSIIDCTMPGLLNPSEEERIYAEQYISFCWSEKGWIADHLYETVNSIFQECGAIEEPCSMQFFDEPQAAEKIDLSYEAAFLELLVAVIDLLIELPCKI